MRTALITGGLVRSVIESIHPEFSKRVIKKYMRFTEDKAAARKPTR